MPLRIPTSRRALLNLGLAAAVSQLSACGAIQGAKNLAKAAIFPTVENLRITTQAQAVTNADDRGDALPVTVRIYLLSESNQILQSSYAELLERDKQALGTSLVQRYEYVAYPQSSSVQEFPVRPETRFIAVMAVMRRTPAPSYYLLDAQHIGTGGIALSVDAQALRMTTGPDPLNKGGQAAGS